MDEKYIVINKKLDKLLFLELINDHINGGPSAKNLHRHFERLGCDEYQTNIWQGVGNQFVNYLLGLMGADVCMGRDIFSFDWKNNEWKQRRGRPSGEKINLEENNLVKLNGCRYAFLKSEYSLEGEVRYTIVNRTIERNLVMEKILSKENAYKLGIAKKSTKSKTNNNCKKTKVVKEQDEIVK